MAWRSRPNVVSTTASRGAVFLVAIAVAGPASLIAISTCTRRLTVELFTRAWLRRSKWPGRCTGSLFEPVWLKLVCYACTPFSPPSSPEAPSPNLVSLLPLDDDIQFAPLIFPTACILHQSGPHRRRRKTFPLEAKHARADAGSGYNCARCSGRTTTLGLAGAIRAA